MLVDVPEYSAISISGVKEWIDEKDRAGKRPESIKVQLYQDESPYGYPLDVPTNNTDKWTFSFGNLPEFHSNSSEKYIYTIKEVDIPSDYTSIVDNASYKITNQYIGESNSETSTQTESISSELISGKFENNNSFTSNSSKKSSSTGNLPSTGEKNNYYMLLLTVLIMVVFISISMNKGRTNESKK